MVSGDDHELPALEDFLARPAWMALASCRGTGTAAGAPTGQRYRADQGYVRPWPVPVVGLDCLMADPELGDILAAGRRTGQGCDGRPRRALLGSRLELGHQVFEAAGVRASSPRSPGGTS